MAGKVKDISGKTFNNIKVISFNSKDAYPNGRSKFLWNCICPKCGNMFIADGASIKSNDVSSCDKCRRAVHVGEKYNRLLVLEEDKDNIGVWKCKCDCGNITHVKGSDMKSGNTQSCGCLSKENISKRSWKDLSGKTFEYAYVNKRIADKYSGTQRVVFYECKCLACGNIFETRGSNLTNGHTISCGCKRRKSKGETFIEFYLNKMNVSYRHNYWFADLRSDKDFPLMFDFGIIDNDNNLKCLIEFQGEQHYYPRDNELFGKYQREYSDNAKKEYCSKNNILLFEITYKENVIEKLYEILNAIHYDYTVLNPSKDGEV